MLVRIGGCRAGHGHRVGDGRLLPEHLAEGGGRGRFEGGHDQAGVLARVGGQDAAAASVGHDRHPGPGRQGLVGEDIGHVEQLAERVDPDHARVAEEGIDDLLAAHRHRPRRPCDQLRRTRSGRPSRRRPAWCERGGGSRGRTCEGCRTTPGTAGRRRCRRPRPSTGCRSLPLTSALLPADTNELTPIPRRLASSKMATPSAPDWAMNPTRPVGGSSRARVAFSRTEGWALATPMQLGPSSRMPWRRARSTSSRWPPHRPGRSRRSRRR